MIAHYPRISAQHLLPHLLAIIFACNGLSARKNADNTQMAMSIVTHEPANAHVYHALLREVPLYFQTCGPGPAGQIHQTCELIMPCIMINVTIHLTFLCRPACGL